MATFLKEVSPEYSLEGLMLKLKLWQFGHLMQITDSLEKTLMLGKIEGRRRRGWQRMKGLDDITDSMDMTLSKVRSWWWTGKPGVLQSTGSQRVGQDGATKLNWMLNNLCFMHFSVCILYFTHTHTQSCFFFFICCFQLTKLSICLWRFFLKY